MMMDFGKSLKLGKGQSLFSAPLNFEEEEDNSSPKQDSDQEEREDAEELSEKEASQKGIEDEEDYGDEIVDLGDDFEPFSMKFKAPFKQEIPSVDTHALERQESDERYPSEFETEGAQGVEDVDFFASSMDFGASLKKGSSLLAQMLIDKAEINEEESIALDDIQLDAPPMEEETEVKPRFSSSFKEAPIARKSKYEETHEEE